MHESCSWSQQTLLPIHSSHKCTLICTSHTLAPFQHHHARMLLFFKCHSARLLLFSVITRACCFSCIIMHACSLVQKRAPDLISCVLHAAPHPQAPLCIVCMLSHTTSHTPPHTHHAYACGTSPSDPASRSRTPSLCGSGSCPQTSQSSPPA